MPEPADLPAAVDDGWITGVERELERSCGADCVARVGVLEAARELLPPPSPSRAWMVRKEGGELALYAITGHSLNTLRGECSHLALNNFNAQASTEITYEQVPIPPAASFKCVIKRTELRTGSGDDERRARTHQRWEFDLGAERRIVVDAGATEPAYGGEPDREQLEAFCKALAAAVSSAQLTAAAQRV